MPLILRETEQFNFLSDDYRAEAKSGNDSLQNVRVYGQKLFATLSRFWPLKGLWVWVNLKCATKISFQTMLNESADVKAHQQDKKELFIRSTCL